MVQRVYLPWDTKVEIGSVVLTPQATNMGIGTEQEFEPYRAYGEKPERVRPRSFGRTLNLAGVYSSAESEALRKLIHSGAEQPFRFMLDASNDKRVIAGFVELGDYTLDSPVEGVVTISGTGMSSGPTYYGAGDHSFGAAQTKAFDDGDAIAVAVESAGADSGANGKVTVTWTSGATSWTREWTMPETGILLAKFEGATKTGSGSRPTAGNWSLRVRATGYDTAATGVWTALKQEAD